jgi:hypothetical protein
LARIEDQLQKERREHQSEMQQILNSRASSAPMTQQNSQLQFKETEGKQESDSQIV